MSDHLINKSFESLRVSHEDPRIRIIAACQTFDLFFELLNDIFEWLTIFVLHERVFEILLFLLVEQIKSIAKG
jgi:hypothetical protein